MKLAQAELKKNQGKNKNLHNQKVKKRSFLEGDKVLVLLPTDLNKLSFLCNGKVRLISRKPNGATIIRLKSITK